MKLTLALCALLASNAAGQGYGPLAPVADEATGLELLQLPAGFRYISYGWTGQVMEDGNITPTDHDGTAVSGVIGDIVSLVRDHECSRGEGPLLNLPASATYGSGLEHGANTNIYFDVKKGEFLESYGSLAGVIRPCAGGLTPWNSWISAEENFSVDPDGFSHGWIFDVPAFGLSNAVPIKQAGRFNHEAAAVDPRTGDVYLTEDTGMSGLYKYVMPGAGNPNWRAKTGLEEAEANGEQFFLKDGGELFALRVVAEDSKDMRGGFADGERFNIQWVKVQNPTAPNTENRQEVFDSAPGAAIFSRGEGAWYENGLIYFVSTNGGEIREGQVWVIDPLRNKLTMQYESRDRADVDGPDNLAVAPNGSIILCEDGGSNPKRLIGLDAMGNTFEFAKNNINLNAADLSLIDTVYPGTEANFWDSVVVEDEPAETRRSFTSREWAGATFYGDWLFVNIQSPGVTFAITGPWADGAFDL